MTATANDCSYSLVMTGHTTWPVNTTQTHAIPYIQLLLFRVFMLPRLVNQTWKLLCIAVAHSLDWPQSGSQILRTRVESESDPQFRVQSIKYLDLNPIGRFRFRDWWNLNLRFWTSNLIANLSDLQCVFKHCSNATSHNCLSSPSSLLPLSLSPTPTVVAIWQYQVSRWSTEACQDNRWAWVTPPMTIDPTDLWWPSMAIINPSSCQSTTYDNNYTTYSTVDLWAYPVSQRPTMWPRQCPLIPTHIEIWHLNNTQTEVPPVSILLFQPSHLLILPVVATGHYRHGPI